MEVLYKIQQAMFFEGASGLFMSINGERWSKSVLKFNVKENYAHP